MSSEGKHSFESIKEKQLQLFQSGATRTLKWRKQQLKTLKALIQENEAELSKALFADLHRSPFETFVAELGPSLQEIDKQLDRMAFWSSPRKQVTNQLIHFWSRAEVIPQPKGNVLIIAPWNYPFYLLFPPLAGAFAAGCTAVLKPSEQLKETTALLASLFKKYFPENEAVLVEGDAAVSQALVEMPWDHIFFTGSSEVGKKIMASAAKNLTPLTLELGGKCPCIIDQSASLKIAAKRIAWGKLLNAGQTCVAPDHLWIDSSIKEEFIAHLKREFQRQFDLLGNDYSHLINPQAFERMTRLSDHTSAWKAGTSDATSLRFPPVLLELEGTDDPSMQEEIFGPVLPMLTFDNDLPESILQVHHSSPLAIYYFDKKNQSWKTLKNHSRSGALVRNEVVMHLAHSNLPFGGIGESGFGHYHGQYSFDCFSHTRSILEKVNWPDAPIRYAPYSGKLKLIRRLFSIR